MSYEIDLGGPQKTASLSFFRWAIIAVLLVLTAGVWAVFWQLTSEDTSKPEDELGSAHSNERPDSNGGLAANRKVEVALTSGDSIALRRSEIEATGALAGVDQSRPQSLVGEQENTVQGTAPAGESESEVSFEEVCKNRFLWPQRVKVLKSLAPAVLYEGIQVSTSTVEAGREYYLLRVSNGGVALLVDGEEVHLAPELTDLMERVQKDRKLAREAFEIEQRRRHGNR
ncbi:MAG: hypothetical protein ACFCU4_03855 [Puniceicoccaceae bacterium]